LGAALERAIGSVRSLAFFVGAALVSSALQLAVSGETGIGLSGVGYALFGFMWKARPRFPSFRPLVNRPVITLFLGWLVFCLVVSHVGVMNVANTAHFAGLVFGVLLGSAMLPRWRRAAIVGATVFCVAGTVTVFWAPWSPMWTCANAWRAQEEGDHDRAIAGFTRAIELDSAFYMAWGGRGQTERLMGDYDAALADLTKAIELEPAYAFSYLERGWVKHLRKDYAGAIADFVQAREVDPDYAWPYGGLAWVRATAPDPEVRDPARAVEPARKAVDLAPEEANLWTTLGVALYSSGQHAAALEALETAMDLPDGGDAYDWFFVAMARHRLGKDDAREWYDKAVAWAYEHEPDDEELQRFRAEAEDVLRLRSGPEHPGEAAGGD
ncbi:MAG: rhomboid family intramembrane serine protease, partial [Deltaproteobacteria bacterium]|nr:rhomboid family intramembrane serine protease [Deltaproteobacteria bacterium]